MKKRLLSGLLSLLMLLTMLPASFAADEADSDTETVIAQNNVRVDTSKQQTESTELETVSDSSSEENTTPLEQPNAAGAAIYVSSSGDDEYAGTEQYPYATLDKAVEAAKNGDTIYLLSDLTSTQYAIVDKKNITIDGKGHKITRGDKFASHQDGGRGGYNPAMIEVANGSTLTLRNITLDDKFLHEGTEFELAGNSQVDNQNKVHDGIIASYGDGNSTIILGEDTTLKNFGGLSAVYITGSNGNGAKLIMESGSKICDDELGEREGGYAAIYNHGGTFEMKSGASIEDIDGRAIYADNAAVTYIDGSISNITANTTVELNTGASSSGFGGIVLYAAGNTQTILGSTAVIRNIYSDDDNRFDVAFLLAGTTFKTAQGSVIEDITTIGLIDSNESTVEIGGRITNCNTNNVYFRLRGGSTVTFKLLETGVIENCKTSDVGLLYLNGGQPNIEISGTIDEINKPVLYLSVNGNRSGGIVTVTETGNIKNITDDAIKAQSSATVTIEGTITDCSGYAVNYTPKADESLLKITDSATIQNNHNGNSQINIGFNNDDYSANDNFEHAVIESGALKANTTIDLSPFDVTLDEDYDEVKLGNASAAAAAAIKNAVATAHSDWEVIGSRALWFQPSQDTIHFTASRPDSVKNTGLFAAIIPLQENGTPADNATVECVEVKNTDPIDVTLTDLTPRQSYAMMFVNNNIYTLAPDDITIYTGGGQGNETYDDGGLPMLTVSNSVDKITSLSVGDKAIQADVDLMAELLGYLTVSYTDADGNPVTSDAKAGEYTATLSWVGGEKPEDLRINSNEVADTFDTGTLIVRYIEDVDGATSGESTYQLLTVEPTEPVTHAEAIAKESAIPTLFNITFYTNDDENREVDAAGIQLLDDSLLIDEDGTDRQSLLEAKAAEYLGSPGNGKAYAYNFHYLDLVDAYNGNAWVSASNGTTVYLPYPKGTDQNTNFTLVHFKDLHREYGISGQADVEAAIEACELETMKITRTNVGIQFDVKKAGFSPFALVWTVDAPERNVAFQPGSHGTLLGTTTYTVTSGSVFGDNGRTIPTVIPNSDYEFSGWLGSDGVTYTSAQVLDLRITNDMTFTAQYQYTGGNHGSDDDGSGDGGGSTTTYYTLTYESNGGTEYDDERYVRNRIVELDKEPTREGYVFTGWYADEELTDRITEIKMTSNKTVYAGWEESSVPDWLNGDDHFAYVTGYPDGTVKPQNDISRAEVATIFFRLLDPDIRDEYLTQTSQFTDVSADAWYNTAVSTMAALGILNGRTADTFVPDAPITRAEFAAICARFDDSDVQKDNAFTDISGHWAEDEIERAAALSWIGGYPNGTFLPDNEITRAEAMTMINRVLQRLPETEDDLLDDMNVWPDNQPQDWYYLAVQEATNSHDFDRKDDGVHETWIDMNADPDWSQYQ